MKNNTPKEVWDALISSKNPICCIDSRFDFDAFGSALALYEVLKKQGITLTLTFDGIIADTAKEIMDTSAIKEQVDPKSVDFTKHDLLIFLDSGTLEHVSKVNEFKIPSGIKTVNIDHHAGNSLYADLNFVTHGASSACVVLYDLLKAVSFEIDSKIAKYLLIGMATDSMFFQAEYSISDDLREAADLIDKGASLHEISNQLSFNETINDYRYRAIIYKNFVVRKDKGYAYSTMTKKEVSDAHIDLKEMTIRGSDLIKRLKGVKLVFSLTESMKESGTYDVSFRSHDTTFSILLFAEALGGGGHKVAAGGVLKGINSIKEAVSKVEEIIAEISK